MTDTAINTINNLVEQYAQKETAAAAEREAAKERNKAQSLTMAQQAVAEAIPDLWSELRPRAVGAYATEADGTVSRLTYTVTLSNLPPFEVVATAKPTSYYRTTLDQIAGYNVYLSRPGKGEKWAVDDAGALFLRLQAAKREEEQKKLDEQLRGLSAKLTTHYHRVKTEEEALAVVRQLDELAPDSTDVWAADLEAWRAWHEAEQQRQAEYVENRRKLTAYANEFRVWARAANAVDARRQWQMDELQARFDGTFTAWQLEYGIVVTGDEERYLDTNSVKVLSDRPDKNGYWQALRHGETTRIRYEYIVSIEGPQEWPVATAGVRISIHKPAYHTFYCAPGREAELEEAIAALQHIEKPDAPNPAAHGLEPGVYYRLPNNKHYDLADVQRRVWSEIESEEEEE